MWKMLANIILSIGKISGFHEGKYEGDFFPGLCTA
jgi:hypothetical protein